MSRVASPWLRNLEEAEEFEDALAAHFAADGILTSDESRLLNRARHNTTRHDETRCVISLGISLFGGGEPARRNYFSQTQRRNRLNHQAGYPALPTDDDEPPPAVSARVQKEVRQEDEADAA